MATLGKLYGKSFCITGTLSFMTRDEAVAKIKQFGGSFDPTPAYGTTYLIVAEKPGEVKLKSAANKGVTKITEGEFLQMLQNTPTQTTTTSKTKPNEPLKPNFIGLESRDW